MKNRIYLRSLEPDDYKVSHKWRNDPEIQDMVGGHKYFVSMEREKHWVEATINDNNRIILAICLKDNDKYIGNIILQEIDWINRSAHTGILIGDKQEWGKGYAKEAQMMMLKFAFEERGMERIMCYVLESNMQSKRMHQKCGYVQEGVLRKAVFKNGKYYNLIVMSVLKDEFFEAYNRYIAEVEARE